MAFECITDFIRDLVRPYKTRKRKEIDVNKILNASLNTELTLENRFCKNSPTRKNERKYVNSSTVKNRSDSYMRMNDILTRTEKRFSRGSKNSNRMYRIGSSSCSTISNGNGNDNTIEYDNTYKNHHGYGYRKSKEYINNANYKYDKSTSQSNNSGNHDYYINQSGIKSRSNDQTEMGSYGFYKNNQAFKDIKLINKDRGREEETEKIYDNEEYTNYNNDSGSATHGNDKISSEENSDSFHDHYKDVLENYANFKDINENQYYELNQEIRSRMYDYATKKI